MTAADALDTSQLVTSVEKLRSLMGDTSEVVWKKPTDTLSDPMIDFIHRSPFCCVASRAASGSTDISPRGDQPGFVRILDRRTLLLPDRPGNRRFDTLRNIIETQNLSLLFMIPRALETVRVNGTAQITKDQHLLAQSQAQGKTPALGVVVRIEEAYGHCAKALKRSDLWEPNVWGSTDGAPRMYDLMRAHMDLSKTELDDMRLRIDNDFKNNLY